MSEPVARLEAPRHPTSTAPHETNTTAHRPNGLLSDIVHSRSVWRGACVSESLSSLYALEHRDTCDCDLRMTSPWRDDAWRVEFTRGARDVLPAFPGILAWGLVTGVAMVKSGLDVPLALFMTLLAYAGSAQLAALPLMATAAPLWVIGLTALLTNVRFVIYAAAMRRWLTAYSPRRRVGLGYLTGDFSFVLFMNRVAQEGAFTHRDGWLLGMSATNWLGWQVASVVGIVAASFVPTAWGLEFAGTLALLALVVPALKHRPTAAGAAAAGVVALAGHAWPFRSGLLAGVVAGITVATLADRDSTTRAGGSIP